MAELSSNVGKVTASLDENAGERPTQIVEAKLALPLGLVERGLVRCLRERLAEVAEMERSSRLGTEDVIGFL
jgi:hypothetical protein